MTRSKGRYGIEGVAMEFRFLRHGIGVGLLVAGLLLGPGISVQAASPGMPHYPWDLRKKMPVHYRAYLKILPAGLKRTPFSRMLASVSPSTNSMAR